MNGEPVSTPKQEGGCESSTDAQITELKTRLQKLNTEYNSFAYHSTHDLAATFRHINTFSDELLNLLDSGQYQQAKNFANLVKKVGKKGATITKALQEYNWAGENEIQVSIIDISQLVASVRELLSGYETAQSSKINITGPTTIEADSAVLLRVLLELIKNSLIYQPKENQIKINIYIEELPNEYTFTFTDNGIGIAENISKKIFNILQRGVRENEFPGIGMGLAVAKKLLELHKGKIELVNDSNEGATFYFTIGKIPGHKSGLL